MNRGDMLRQALAALPTAGQPPPQAYPRPARVTCRRDAHGHTIPAYVDGEPCAVLGVWKLTGRWWEDEEWDWTYWRVQTSSAVLVLRVGPRRRWERVGGGGLRG